MHKNLLSLSNEHVRNSLLLLKRILIALLQELLSLTKRKRMDSDEPDEPVSKPAASSDSETSDSDDEV